MFATFGLGSVVQDSMVYAGRDVEIISHRGIVDGEFENSLSAVRASLDVDYLTVYKGMLSDELVQRVNRSEKGLFVWTVNSEEAIRKVLQYNIEGIITDYPLRVQEVMGRRGE